MKLVAIIVAFFVASLSAAWMASPLLRERVLWLGMIPFTPAPVQHLALKQLRDYPTRATAIALVLFTNLKYSYPRSEADLEALARVSCKDHTEETQRQACARQELERLTAEEKAQARARERNNKVAETAVETLCVISGESFGSYFEPNQWGGHTWGSLSDERWRVVLGGMNFWAFQQFGAEVLAAAGLGSLAQELSVQIKAAPALLDQATDQGTTLPTVTDAATNLTEAATGALP